MQRPITKATILDLTANAIPDEEAFKIFILEWLEAMIPSEELAQQLSEIDDRRVRQVLTVYKAYAGIEGPVRLGDAIAWFKHHSKNVILDYERRMGEIAALLNVFGTVDPGKIVEVPGSVIIDLRFPTRAVHQDKEP